jgi:hypothetical protein
MATLKEFTNAKTGVQVYVGINHSDKTVRSRIIDAWTHGYAHEPNGKRILAWVEIKPDVPVKIPCADVTITSVFKEQRQTTISNRKIPDYQNHFAVTISKGILSETFDYHASINDADKGIVNLTDNDKIGAFYCFVQDAISGIMPFKEFKSEYGYDDCCEAHRVWKLCQEATIKATRLGLGDLYVLSEKIQVKYPDVV